SQFFPFFLAHASRLLPSSNTTAPLGGAAPNVGDFLVTRLRVKLLSPLVPANCPSLICPLQLSPLKVTPSAEPTPSRTATTLLAVSKAVRMHARYFPPPIGNTCATYPPCPCQSPMSGSAVAATKFTGCSPFLPLGAFSSLSSCATAAKARKRRIRPKMA